MKILIVEPYLTGSHTSWAREYADRSSHDVAILGLKGKYWKWRMHGGAVRLAGMFMESGHTPDIILASDMLDLSVFLALTRARTACVRTAVYFHENQITYPGRENESGRERDAQYGFINYTSALAADAVLFNSSFHHDSFLNGIARFLKVFPDHNGLENVPVIREKSRVLPLGLDLEKLDLHREGAQHGCLPLILWNHRWEYDKNPEEFFRALFMLAGKGLQFEVAILGEEFARKPAVFEEARLMLGDKIVQYGFVEGFNRYAYWLWKSDILPVTSIHDFFGASMVQGVYCGCRPLLPKRLSYPEHISPEENPQFYYDDFEGLCRMLEECILKIEDVRRSSSRDLVARYDWSIMAPEYDRIFSDLLRYKS